jgi:ferric-dicitrate binding protein FerR (iron transport regulator)
MGKEKFWLLVSLKLSGEATAEELDELHGLLRQFPELNLQLEMIDKLWQQKHAGINTNTEDAFNKHLQRLSNHLSKPALEYEQALEESETDNNQLKKISSPFRLYRRLYIAGAAVAASLIFFFLLNYKSKSPAKLNHSIAENTVSTKPGSKSKLQLPDGTQVWLNGDSKITYDENFLGDFREVQLTGEAYFDVAKDKEHPFIIHTQTIDLKVLGTAFNVRSYANEKNTEASLIHGSIEITVKNNPDKKIILKPDEKLIIQNALGQEKTVPGKKIVKQDQPLMVLDKIHFKDKDSSATEIMWVKNKLAFDKESLEDIASKIERWYDVKVIITDDRLKESEYSGVFTDETLPEVMEALQLTGNFKYAINKKEIIIKP